MATARQERIDGATQSAAPPSAKQSPIEYLDSLQGSGIRPGLGRMRALLRALGNPHRDVPAIIVAGTNGKGSTSAMIASILSASGYRTGLYTSPHLVDLRERWTIDGAPIAQEVLDDAIVRMRDAAMASGIAPTYFEALTLIAFIVFALAPCDLTVLEVGMGGRLDATNVVRPLASVITPIGMDHMEYLGPTLVRIAHEKAGVIHRGACVLTSNDDPRVLEVIRRRAAKFGAGVTVIDGQHDTPLAGDFQRRNAALAVATARSLMTRLPRITEESIGRGVAGTRWPGRLQHFQYGGVGVWVDGGHNGHAARAIAPFIERNLARPRTLVFGIMADKDVVDVTSTLFPLFDDVIATNPYAPRGEEPANLLRIANRLGVRAEIEQEPAAAIERAIAGAPRSLVIAGSLYLAGAALSFFD